MTTLYADPYRVAIYTGSSTAPETNPYGNLSAVKFHTDLDYVRIVRPGSATVSLASLGVQTSGNTDPAVFVNHVLETHGLGYTPLVFGFATIGGAHVPLRGSVPVQKSGGDFPFGRFISLGASSTQVILNEYCVKNFVSSGGTAYAELSVAVTYFITEEAL